MAEFTAITTEEDFLAAVTERFGDVRGMQEQLNTLSNNIATLTQERDTHASTIEELRGQIHSFETEALRTRIAREKGIPYELAGRIAGDTEEAMAADADVLLGVINTVKGPAPMYQPAPTAESKKDKALRDMLNKLEGAM